MMTSEPYTLILAGLLPLPGHCVVCGSNQRDCVDIGFTAEYFGAVLICTDCIKPLAQIPELGFRLQSDVEYILAANELLSKRDAAMTRIREDLRRALVAVADSVDERIIAADVDTVFGTEVSRPEPVDFSEVFRSD